MLDTLSTSHFLDALFCKNRGRPPIWIMRQAGRYLPEYRAIRNRHSLREMFFNPELACQITQLPIHLFSFDAAVIFSDILVIAKALGKDLDYIEGIGPVVDPVIQVEDVDTLVVYPLEDSLDFVTQTIELCRKEISVPLLGFCGAPFTVACYLLEEKISRDIRKVKKWIYNHSKTFHKLLDLLCTLSCDYLRMQYRAGVSAVQVFDSWAHLLSYEQFCTFSLPYLKKICTVMRKEKIPVILFARNTSFYPEKYVEISPNVISFDWYRPLNELRKSVPPTIAVQGNLDPDFLYGSHKQIASSVKQLLYDMKDDPGFIMNLGHGIKPDVPVDAVRCMVDTVGSYSS